MIARPGRVRHLARRSPRSPAAIAADNAAALLAILEGERSPRADVIALNAALALVVAERAASLAEGLATARERMRDGSALAVLETLRRPAALAA